MFDWVLNTPLSVIFYMKQFESFKLFTYKAYFILHTYILYATPARNAFLEFFRHFHTTTTLCFHAVLKGARVVGGSSSNCLNVTKLLPFYSYHMHALSFYNL